MMETTYEKAKVCYPESTVQEFVYGEDGVEEITSWRDCPAPGCTVTLLKIRWADGREKMFNLHHAAWWDLA